jgi:tetratricopeptide (TPR) repeat protein
MPLFLDDGRLTLPTPEGLRTRRKLVEAGKLPEEALEAYAPGGKVLRPVVLPGAPRTAQLAPRIEPERALLYDPKLLRYFPWIVFRDLSEEVRASQETPARVVRESQDYFRQSWREAARFEDPRGGPGLTVLERPNEFLFTPEKVEFPIKILTGFDMAAVRDTSEAFTEWVARSGEALRAVGSLRAARGFLRIASMRSPRDAEIQFQYALALLLDGRDERAKSQLLTALAIREDHGPAHYNLGNLLEKEGDLAGAEVEYRAAIQYLEDPVPAHARLGALLARRGDRDEAREELETIRRLAPGSEAERFLEEILAGS